ncbi:MAG: hypothetical protein MJY57_01925, partial [Bacteroidales bacterium]|nr:hypothetical protein [Bacteroidales bacterium]
MQGGSADSTSNAGNAGSLVLRPDSFAENAKSATRAARREFLRGRCPLTRCGECQVSNARREESPPGSS